VDFGKIKVVKNKVILKINYINQRETISD